MASRLPESDVLLIATDDESARKVGTTLRTRMARDEASLPVITRLGDALRRVVIHQPKLLLVCATPSHAGEAATLIAQLRRRGGDQGTALVGVVAAHDETIERALRIAGVTHYLALDSPADEEVLRHLFGSAGIPPPDCPSHAGPAPPSRGLPPPTHVRHRLTRNQFPSNTIRSET